MRYHYVLPEVYTLICGQTYICNHPVYSRCTLYTIKKLGLAVIQQRIDEETKATTWTEIDPWLVDEIYMHSGFRRYFEQKAGEKENDLYPTVTVRQIMWALRMKPLEKERWETVFDRKTV